MKNQSPVIDEILQGKTLKIYWYLLTHPESGIREIQRKLKIASPSTVSYHLNKLVSVGLITKSTKTDKYSVEEATKSGIIGLYIKLGRLMVPRFVFYTTFFGIGIIFYFILIISRRQLTFFAEDFLFLFFMINGLVVFAYEAYRIWTMKPL